MNKDLRVLIVEDSAADAELIMHMLIETDSHLEYELVDTAQDTKRALGDKSWDVILCDYSMPNMSPYVVLDILREIELDVPIIVISGKIGEEEAIKLLKAGCHDCLMKNDLRRLPDVINRETKDAIVREQNRILDRKLQKYQLLCDAASDIMLFLDVEGMILDANLAAIQCYGYSYQEFLGKNIVDFEQVSNNEMVKTKLDTAIPGKLAFEAIHYRKDNTTFFAEVSSQGVLLKGQNIIFCIVRDITERKRNEADREHYVKDILESQRIAHLGTWRLDLATGQVVWSEELYKMYGFDPSVPPPPYTEHMKLFTPESWERLSDSLERTSAFGIPYELELNTITRDGSNGWMWVRGEAERDSEGKIVSLWGAARDITDQKKIEYEIRQSEEKFQLLFNEAPLGYQSLDLEGRFIEVNQKWLDTLGYAKEEVVGRWFGDFLCPEYIETFRKCFQILITKGSIHNEYEMLSKDGLRLNISFDGKVGYGIDGELKQAHCILQDITNQRKAENALIESEERYRCLFEYSGVGIGYYTPDGVVISFNKRAIENLGGKLEDYIGKSMKELFPKEEADLYLSRIEKAISTEQPQDYEDHLVLNARARWFASTFTRITNKNKETIGVQIASLDITERKKTESDLIYLSDHDYLTGFYNRKYFEEQLRNFDIATNLPLSIIICDINGLKLINDSFGHDFGDMLLIKAAKAMKEACSENAIISRIGGDEFAVLLPNTNDEEIVGIADNMKKMAVKEKVENIELSLSYGYDTKTDDRQNITEVLSNAENHMYRHKLYERSSMRSKTIDIIMNTLFEKSSRESQHSNRVSAICSAIALEMNFDRDDVNKIRIAGLVHDIGKIGIDEKILNKSGFLNGDEREQINKHPEIGWRILSSVNEFSELAQYILAHHERWDGSGYPNALRGEKIPIESRIITIADSYDAITSARSYRAGVSQEEAVNEMQRCSGTQFDPGILETFVNKVLPFNVFG